MQPVSDEFKKLIKDGYTTSQLVEVYGPGGDLLQDSTTFQVVSGDITVDGAANYHRWVNDLIIADATGDLVPTETADLFSAAAGNELRIYNGMILSSGDSEMLLQGIFGLAGANIQDSPSGLVISLSAYDRARSISRNKITKPPYTINNNTNAITAASSLILNRRPGTVIRIIGNDPGHTLPYGVLEEQTDPWQAAREILESIGWEAYFDVDGSIIFRPVLDPNATSGLPVVWTYAEGVDATMISVGRDLSNEEAYNGQVVTGENSFNITPARGEAWDDDPTSPTYYLGPYGKVPEFWHSEKIRTNAQAVDAAKGRLNLRKGITDTVEFAVVPNPAHVYGDVVTIQRTRSQLNNQFIIDRFNIGLGARSGAMTIRTRQRRLTA